MSLIADSLKKAVKEKSFNVKPGINLLKNLSTQNKPKIDPKEVKRFVILIVIPATILIYLLLDNPFDPNKRLAPAPPPQAAKAPPIAPVPKPTPSKPSPPLKPSKVPIKEPETAPVIEPGMTKITVSEETEESEKDFAPKPVPGPKKKSLQTITQEPASPKPVVEPPLKKRTAKTEPSREIKLDDSIEVPQTSRKSTAPKPGKPSTPPTPTTPGPNIPKDSDHYFNRAIFYQQSRDWDKALTNYSRAAELNANNPDIYNNIGVIYKELRQYERAIEEFLKAIDLNPDYAKPYNNIGVVYYAKKDYPSAIRNYQKAILIDPENLEAMNNLAVAYKQTGQLDRSKTVLSKALKINPAHAGTHYNLAVLYESEGNIESAIHFYQRFVDLASSSHPTLTVQVRKHINILR